MSDEITLDDVSMRTLNALHRLRIRFADQAREAISEGRLSPIDPKCRGYGKASHQELCGYLGLPCLPNSIRQRRIDQLKKRKREDLNYKREVHQAALVWAHRNIPNKLAKNFDELAYLNASLLNAPGLESVRELINRATSELAVYIFEERICRGES
jgi:hypothetical protein